MYSTVHLLKTGDGCSLEMEERCLDHAATPSTWAQFSNILPCLGCVRKLESGRRPDQIGAQDVPPFCQLSISSSVALELLCAVETWSNFIRAWVSNFSRLAQNFIIISCMVTRFEIRDLNLDLRSIRHARMQAAAQQQPNSSPQGLVSFY